MPMLSKLKSLFRQPEKEHKIARKDQEDVAFLTLVGAKLSNPSSIATVQAAIENIKANNVP
jgi:hypothetical protein